MSVDSFVAKAIALDGVSVTDAGEEWVATCEEQAEGTIDTTPVHATAEETGHLVSGTVADFDAGTVRVFVAKDRANGDQEEAI